MLRQPPQIPDAQAEVEQLRARVAEAEDRVRQGDAQLDLMRNALQRRDSLLVQQRTAFFRELMQHKGYAHISNIQQPSNALDEVLKMDRLATAGRRVAEKPAFFDACVFEAAHVEVDEEPARKAAAALHAASAREEGLKRALEAAGQQEAKAKATL